MPDSVAFVFSPADAGPPGLRHGPAPKPAPMPPLQPSAVQGEQAEEIVLGQSYINPADQLRLDVAMLTVDRDGPETFTVKGSSSVVPLEPRTSPYQRPGLALGDLAQKGSTKTPRQIYGRLMLWSQAKPEIVNWLTQVREAVNRKAPNQELHLVIADGTGFDIPWEMLDLPAAGAQPGGLLGALLPVVRWHPALGELEAGLDAEPTPGRVLAYVDEALKGTRGELELLRRFDLHLSRDLGEFAHLLQTEQPDVGLVYLACHGIFNHDDLDEVRFESLLDKQHRLVLGELYWERLDLLRRSRSIVFLNACSSARLVLDSIINDGELRGFVHLFLTQGASGVIGTVGKVGDEFASETTQELVKAALKTPDHSIAVLLRNRRAKVIDEVGERSDESLLQVLYAFMYVYYGSPTTHLKITGWQANP